MKLITTLLVAALGAAAHATYLVNGDFESGSPGATAVMRSPWVAMIATPDTWDVTGVNGALPGLDNIMTGATAKDGNCFVGLNNINRAVLEMFGQVMPTAIQGGETFTFSTWLRNDPGGIYPANTGIDIYLANGLNTATRVLVGSLSAPTNDGQWTNRTATFTAPTGTWTGFLVETQGTDGVPAAYIGIDGMSLTPVPEPATIVLFGLGLARLVYKRQRTRE